MENGGPAPESVTDKIYENTKTIKEYLIAEGLPDVWSAFKSCLFSLDSIYFFIDLIFQHDLKFCQVDISTVGVSSFTGPEGQFDVDVFDSTTDYVKLMKYVIFLE